MTALVRALARSSVSIAVFVPAGRIERCGTSVAMTRSSTSIREIAQRVEQAWTVDQAQLLDDIGLCDIGIDEQDFGVALRRDREREVDRAERLAILRAGRAHQDHPRLVRAFAFGNPRAGDQQLPLDQAKLLRERTDRCAGHDHAVGGEHPAIDPCGVVRILGIIDLVAELVADRRAQFLGNRQEGRVGEIGSRCRGGRRRGHRRVDDRRHRLRRRHGAAAGARMGGEVVHLGRTFEQRGFAIWFRHGHTLQAARPRWRISTPSSNT
ncbi:hypothetical protein [Sphingomonas aurantiaca]|uniref:hypothetical protein n=1 Tax=Sphingomonas aurantiaca TaxID=185949 RepID=UPI002FE35352